MIADGTMSAWHVIATNVNGVPIEQTNFRMFIEGDEFHVEIQIAECHITVQVRDAETRTCGHFDDDEYEGHMQSLVDAVAFAYDECIDALPG